MPGPSLGSFSEQRRDASLCPHGACILEVRVVPLTALLRRLFSIQCPAHSRYSINDVAAILLFCARVHLGSEAEEIDPRSILTSKQVQGTLSLVGEGYNQEETY